MEPFSLIDPSSIIRVHVFNVYYCRFIFQDHMMPVHTTVLRRILVSSQLTMDLGTRLMGGFLWTGTVDPW